jgi:acyl-CoA synthetase (NDP forming)
MRGLQRSPRAIRSTSEQLETEKERLWVTARFVKAGIPVFKTVERASRALYKYTGYYRRLVDSDGG